jgi:voltage-gated potassium channel
MPDRARWWRRRPLLSPRRRVRFYLLLFIAQILVYTSVFRYLYPFLEGKPISWPASLLFVIETVTTVGYGDLLPFQNQFTIFFAILVTITGIFNIFMLVPLLLEPYLSAIINPTPPRQTPHALSGHVVIVGYNEAVRELVENLTISSVDVVIAVEEAETAQKISDEHRRRVYGVWGDYADPQTWENAWIGKAGTVVVYENERTAANVILGIRELTQGKIIAVVDDLAFDRYLRYAGADFVLSPKNSAGKILARHATEGSHSAILDAIMPESPAIEIRSDSEEALQLVNIPMMPGTTAAGKSIRDLELFPRYGVLLLSYWKGGVFVPTPDESDTVDETMMLYVLGRVGAIHAIMREQFASDHHEQLRAVIAGFGDVGRAAFGELSSAGISCTVVDRKKLAVSGIVGNAEDEEILRRAQIEESQICVVALNDDSVNIFATLMARNLSPGIRILARANLPASVDKLYRAGADYVALLPAIGGQVIAGIVLVDQVSVMLDLPDRRKVVLKDVMRGAPLAVADIEANTGVRVIGIETATESQVKPPADMTVQRGDAVIVLGTNEALRRFIELF